ncbi:MAG: hypothetical protein K6F49_11765 [Saccharofermentans sp.]|nr:hypothetical protein [Saccharofermentans sp.]
MSLDFSEFNKESLNFFLKELSKELRREYGKSFKAEIILVGGAAVLANYDFRNGTNDIDVYIRAGARIKDAINIVGDKYNLPNGWMNSDFVNTDSYSPKLIEHSVYYRSFGNGVLEVRTIKDEYLMAMKLRALRRYKHDMSDLIGIADGINKSGQRISKEGIFEAYRSLYGEEASLSNLAVQTLDAIVSAPNLSQLYLKTAADEKNAKESLVTFEKDYPNVLNQENLDDVLNSLLARDQSLIPDEVKKQFEEPDNSIHIDDIEL